jgi:hypothetical protein
MNLQGYYGTLKRYTLFPIWHEVLLSYKQAGIYISALKNWVNGPDLINV